MTLIDIGRPDATDDHDTAAVVTAPAPRPPRQKLFGDLAGPLSITWGFALVAAWTVVVAIGYAVEPAAVDPDAPVPLLAALLNSALLATWGAMAAGIVQRRRLAAVASMVGGVALLALTVACPTSGHHSFGAWWGVQLAGAVGLLALSGRALRRS